MIMVIFLNVFLIYITSGISRLEITKLCVYVYVSISKQIIVWNVQEKNGNDVVVRALASNQCGTHLIPRLSVVGCQLFVGSHPFSMRFLSGYYSFPLSLNRTIPNCNLILNLRATLLSQCLMLINKLD